MLGAPTGLTLAKEAMYVLLGTRRLAVAQGMYHGKTSWG